MLDVVDLTQDSYSSPQVTSRQTRSSTRSLRSQTNTPINNTTTSSPPPPSSLPSPGHPFRISGLTLPLKSRLRPSSHTTLLRKRNWLETHTIPLPRNLTHNPVPATLVFAQEEAGSAVCISPNGVILTCSHCVAETPAELDLSKTHWLLFATGEVVCARTVAWDAQRDLALLVITEASNPSTSFPYIPISTTTPKLNTRLLCIGHPGSEDLEASSPNTLTNYDTLVLSTGTFRGLAKGQDPQDNSDIGALMHNCWTYWGHSGAPLVERNSGGSLAHLDLEGLVMDVDVDSAIANGQHNLAGDVRMLAYKDNAFVLGRSSDASNL
ncbi:Fc.00g005600.m01.CDS01 [Cosmosporella sp. VM-42]